MLDVSPFVNSLDGKPIVVMGLAVSGLSVVKALIAAGATIHAWDVKEEAREKAQALGASITPLTPDVIAQSGCIVLSPGVPLHHPEPHPVAQMASDLGVDILGDIEIFHRCNLQRKTIGVTGTNGKSTTVNLIQHVLQNNGSESVLAGNVGVPLLTTDLPSDAGVFVLELSSYQLDLCPDFAPDIGVFLNISADHIDRHGTVDKYVEAKARVFRGQGIGIIGVDDPYSKKLYDRLKRESALIAASTLVALLSLIYTTPLITRTAN